MSRLALLLVALAACTSSRHSIPKGAPDPDAAIAVPDAPPPPLPSVDAGPPPMMTCGGDAGMTCPLPPSTCLDTNYLVYYTGGTCDGGACQFMTNLLYCYGGCVNGGCQGGFT